MLVHHLLEKSALQFPDKIALIFEDRRLSYSQINDASNQVAKFLAHIGVLYRNRVVIYLDNSIESIISMFGILKTGAIFITPNSVMKSKKLNYILKDSGAYALITSTNKNNVVIDALKDLPVLKHVIWVGEKNQIPAKASQTLSQHFWGDIYVSSSALNTDPNTFVLKSYHKAIDIDLATIIYTSGSTAEPKGVMSAHYNMISTARSITQYLKNTEKSVILCALPLSFDYGLYQVVMTFMCGGTLVLEKAFAYPYQVLKRIDQEEVTGFPIVPTMAAIMFNLDDLSRFKLSSLRYITNTAASLPPSYSRRLNKLFPQVKIYSMYGLTECKRVSYLPPEEIDRRPDSVGIPIPNVEAFIVDDKGEQIPPNEVGELVVRGSNVMQGYWNDPELTRATFRPGRYRGETFLYTGDLFKKDEDGFLYFVARKDSLIKTKGERVSPKEIEDVLCEMDGIIEAVVIGVPDEISGQAIKAYIVTKEKFNITEEQIKNHCIKNIEPFMTPKYIKFVKTIPKTANGKIDKTNLN